MARDTSGPKNEPRYDPNGVPADAADLTEVAAYAALVGNLKVLTSAQRVALTGPDRWVGLYVEETDTGLLWKYTAGGWVMVLPSSGDQTVTPVVQAGFSPPSVNALDSRAGIAFLSFNAVRSAGSAVGQYVVAIPPGFRGDRNVWTHAWGLSGAASAIQCYYDVGVHMIRMQQVLTTGQSIALSMNWPVRS